jgi:hypothetical protein
MDGSVFDPQTFDLGIILTAAGIPIAAGIIAAFIQLMKRVPAFGPWLDSGKEAALNIVLSAALVAYAAAAIAVPINLVSGFMLFLAWVNLAGFASKVYDVAPDNVKSAIGGTAK